MGAVARRATQIHTRTGSIAAHVVRSWFTQDNEGFEKQLAELAEQVNIQAERDAPEKIICPSLAALEKMPRQHVLSEKLYTNRRKELLRAPGQSDEVRAFRLSNCQFNAGSWLNSIPMLSRFKCSSAVFKVMLQFRLCLPLAYSDGVKECARRRTIRSSLDGTGQRAAAKQFEFSITIVCETLFARCTGHSEWMPKRKSEACTRN